jgi:hypothetical protein
MKIDLKKVKEDLKYLPGDYAALVKKKFPEMKLTGTVISRLKKELTENEVQRDYGTNNLMVIVYMLDLARKNKKLIDRINGE